MTPKEELQSLLESAQNTEVKQVLSDAISKYEAEAKTALESLEAHLTEEGKAILTRIKSWL